MSKKPIFAKKPFDAPVSFDQMDRTPGREETTKRTRSSKIFNLGHNLHQAVLFADPVHYQDKHTGKLQEIDNTLISKTDNAGNTYLTNRANDELKVEFHRTTDAVTVLLQNEDDRILAWQLEEAMDVMPEQLEKPCMEHSDCDLRRGVLAHLEDGVIYHDIFPDADMHCRIQSVSFKDEIIFRNKAAVHPISFLISMPDMIPSRQDNGNIDVIAPTGEVAFTLPKPFMKDANPENSVGTITYTLQPTSERDLWRMIYVPDPEWLETAQFPVVMDPAVITKKHSTAIEDNFVTSMYPDTVQTENYDVLRISRSSSTWGDSIAYIRFLDSGLPEIDSSYYITKAYLTIQTSATNAYGIGSSNPTSPASLYLSEVLSDWSSSSITYNNAPAFDDYALDYVYVESAQTPYTFDISNLVRKWYAGTNYGFALDARNSTFMNLQSSNHMFYKPYVTINYVSLAGLEDYLAYEQQSAGRAGTGYVNLYNGNLIFEHSDITSNGNLMPVSVSHYYNSCYYDVDPFLTGYGWQTNLNQYLHRETVVEDSGDVTYYVYTDGDGTRHHFKQINGKWKDQSGLGMKLEITGSSVTITTKDHTRMSFSLPSTDFNGNYDNVQMLDAIHDADYNTISIEYDSYRRLTGYTDGANRHAFIRAYGDHSIDSSIQYQNRIGDFYPVGYTDGGACGCFYDANNRLNRIWTRKGDTGYVFSNFTYNALGLLETVTNADGLKLTYSYYTSRKPYRVSQVVISNGNTLYGGRKFVYGDCKTTVIDLIPTVIAENNSLVEGKKLFYHFNDYGNVVSVNDELGYAAFAKYSDELPVNHPETVSKLQRSIVNLLNDHSFENGGVWSLSSCFSYVSNNTYMGNKALKVTTQGTTGMHSASQRVQIEPGKTYTLSFYVKKSGDIDVWACYSYTDASGSTKWVHAPSMKSQLTTEYSRLHYTFTVPDTASSDMITVILYAGAADGIYPSAWFDCVQLEEGPVPNRYNMLINGDFTLNCYEHPTAWNANGTNDSMADIVYYNSYSGKPETLSPHVMRLCGDGRTKYAGIYQDINISGSEGDVFSAGGWSRNYSKPRKGENFRYNIRVAFLKSGTSSTREDTPSIEWSEEWSGWQFAAGPVVAPFDYSAIRFNIDYERNINFSEYGGLFLHKEEFGKTFDYDENGNVLSTKNLASLQSHATYDDYDNLLTYRQPGRPSTVKYTQTWGSSTEEKERHLLRTSTSPLGIVQEYDYDEYGNPTLSKTKNAAGTQIIKNTTTYTDDKNYIATQTDARGKTVTTNYDLERGTLTSVTDPNGQTVSYTYDHNRRVTGVQTTANNKTYRNTYTYENDRVKQVAHNTTLDTTCDVAYNFTYDGIGRPSTVSVGTQQLSENTYNPDGTLQKVSYGNSTEDEPQEIRYTYDEYKRVTGMRFDFHSDDILTYQYGANGQVSQVENHFNGTVTTSEYDLANRPMRIRHMCGDDHIYTGEVAYDEFNNLKTFKEKVGDSRTPYQTDFTYDVENKPSRLTYGSTNDQVSYEYNSLGLPHQRIVTINAVPYSSQYTYLAGSNGEGNATALISAITQTGENCSYTYDNVGNIATATRNGVTTKYTYDNLGQLIRVDDPADTTSGSAGTTWVYEYDRGGNITAKKRYAYTTGAVGTLLQNIPYTYNATWKDKLATYNGQTITSDAIGNTLNDGTWTYYWEMGRRLWQMEKGNYGAPNSVLMNFNYNAEGIRIGKLCDSHDASGNNSYVHTDYYVHGKKIVHMTQSNNNLHFFYDAQGRPAVVNYNGTKYAYILNLQGDVLGLRNSSGTEVVKYTYDAWGKILSTTGSMASSLGKLNPFRYRGYVYDEETGLYYLLSRYYNPEWGRFINADKLVQNNLFNYCHNQPITRIDPSGFDSVTLTKNVADSSVAYPKQVMPAKLFVTLITQSVTTEGWKYEYGHSMWKETDCVGLPKYILNWYYSRNSFKELSTITNGRNKGQIYNQVKDLASYGLQYGDTWEIDDPNEIPIGAAVFIYDPSNPAATNTNKGWIHVGIYIGQWDDIEHAVAEAASESEGVRIGPLHDGFTLYGLFKRVDYR